LINDKDSGVKKPKAMTSFKSQIFNLMMRNSYLFRGKLKKETFDLNTSIEQFREDCEKGAARYAKIPDGVTVKEQIIEGIKTEWLIPAEANSEKLIMYVHGGGYVSGSCSDHRGFVSKFAKFTGITNLVFEYRLAPENPFPAALDDSVKVYHWLLDAGYKPENIVIAGESAGGGLCLATLLALKENKIPVTCCRSCHFSMDRPHLFKRFVPNQKQVFTRSVEFLVCFQQTLLRKNPCKQSVYFTIVWRFERASSAFHQFGC
jgi:hypothetical protein